MQSDESSLLLGIQLSGERFRFRRRDILWHPGDKATHLVLVGSGALKLCQPVDGGGSRILGLVAGGELAGLEAAVPSAPYGSGCRALATGHGWRIHTDLLQRTASADRRVAAALMAATALSQRRFAARLHEFLDGDVEHRLATLLRRLAVEHGTPDARGVFIPLPLTRKDLSEMLGCRSETVIRTMTRWTRDGLVLAQREGLILRDAPALSQRCA